MTLSAATARTHAGWRDILLLLSIGLFWGLNWPAVRVMLDEVPPFTMRAAAFTVGALVLLALVRLRGERLRPAATDWPALIPVALLSIFGFNM
ncbi:MAG: EamA family transporter, partial [Pseudomonadota bacterium]